MLPRWLWFNHVPAGLDLTAEQRAEVSRRVREMGPGQRRFTPLSRRLLKNLLPGMFALLLLFAAWLVWLVRGAAGVRGPWIPLLNITGILVFNGLIWIVLAWSFNRAVAPLVWKALNQIGIRVCEECGYIVDYLPLDAQRCPECGEALRPPTDPDFPAGHSSA